MNTIRRSPGARILSGAGVLLLVLPAYSAPADDDGRVLHEYLPLAALACSAGSCRRSVDDVPAALPDAIQTGAGVVERPVLPPTPLVDEPIYAGRRTGAPIDVLMSPSTLRRERVGMDRDTGELSSGGPVHVYHEVFEPAIWPYKRMTAFDAVADDETLYIADPRLQPLPVLGAATGTGGRERFYGAVMLDLEPGQWLPLPSAGAGVRILSWDVSPQVPLEFAHDHADNVYVRSRTGAGRHRLVWLEDVPEQYFSGPLPPEPAIAARQGPHRGASVPRVPEHMLARVERVLRRIGIERGASPGANLFRLVAWFRGFTPGELGAVGSSTYLDVALGRRGVCRHRAYAFVITALGLGIPARYVENEVHVYVEVLIPGQPWRRIDLGGGALDVEARNLDGKAIHVPSGVDPFAQPASYLQGRPSLLSVPQAPGHPFAEAADAGSRQVEGPLTGLAASPDSAPAPLVSLLPLDGEAAFRGEHVRIAGRVGPSGELRPSHWRVQILLVSSTGVRLVLGDAAVREGGGFELAAPLPSTLPLGSYHVRAQVVPVGARP